MNFDDSDIGRETTRAAGQTGEPPTSGSHHQISEGASQLARHGMEEVKRIGQLAKEKAVGSIDGVFDQLRAKLDDVAEMLEGVTSTGEERGGLPVHSAKAAEAVRSVSRRLESLNTDELTQVARRQVAARPAIAFAGCFALGFLAARLLRR